MENNKTLVRVTTILYTLEEMHEKATYIKYVLNLSIISLISKCT